MQADVQAQVDEHWDEIDVNGDGVDEAELEAFME